MKPVLAHFFCAHMPPHDALRSRVGGAVTPADAISPTACKGDQSDGQEFSDGILDAEAVWLALATLGPIWLATNDARSPSCWASITIHPARSCVKSQI